MLQSDLPESYFIMQPDPVLNHSVPGMHIWGWMSPDELTWLGSQASKMESIIEIGSLHGRSSFALLTGCKGKVYCIDPWNDPGEYCIKSFLSSCGHFSNLVPVQGYSHLEFDNLPDVDMVFIDGNHDRNQVTMDIELYLPKAKKLICGHDYIHGGGFPDVAEVVDEHFDKVVVPKDTAIWAVGLNGFDT